MDNCIATARPAIRKPKRAKWFSILDWMVLPGILYLLINNYIPMFGLFIAFKRIDYAKGLFASDWTGFDNFKYLFATSDAWVITSNTLLYNIAFIVLLTVVGIAVGLLLNEISSKLFVKIHQTAILLPQLISIIVIANIVFAFLSNEAGVFNKTVLPALGVQEINFYSSPQYWPFILVFVFIWNRLGYSSIIYYASIISIDGSLFEAAKIDGASKLRQIVHITLPQLKPTIVTLVLIQVGRIFYSDFGLFYQVPMNSGALFRVTNVIDTYVYRGLLELNNIQMASAAGAYQSVVGLLMILFANMIIKKLDPESGLF